MKIVMKIILCSLLPLHSYALSLSEYLEQVEMKNAEATSYKKTIEASELKSAEANLIFRPQFFSEIQLASEGKQPVPPSMSYDKIESQNYQAGLAQQFNFGLKTRLYYELTHTNFINSSLPSSIRSNDYSSTPTLELSLPLWANGLGRTARSQEAIIIKSSLIDVYTAKAKLAALNVNAENSYWALVSTRDILRIQKKALEQAESILGYVKNQSFKRLGDKGSVLQASALVASRQLELRKAEMAEQLALKQLNDFRGGEADAPSVLDEIPYSKLSASSLPKILPFDRYDLLAEKIAVEVASENAVLSEEKNKPSFDVYGVYAFNGQSDSVSDANSRLAGGEKGTRSIGLKLNIPLDLSSASKARLGARTAAESQKYALTQKVISQDKDWNILFDQCEFLKNMYSLAEKLLQAQSEKLIYEKGQLKQGRTTTYQVLLFEQDSLSAELNRIQIAKELLQIVTTSKLYTSEKVK